MKLIRSKGFTLAELLIALAILGVIATFTIPKILSSSTSGQNTAIAKEAASMVSGAFSSYQLNNSVAAGTTAGSLTDFMNYVKIDTATSYTKTEAADAALQACSAVPCLVLHNGGILQYDPGQSFGTTVNNTGAVYFNLDPDGNGARGRITFVQFINGRLTTGGNVPANSDGPAGSTITKEAADPTYLTNWN